MNAEDQVELNEVEIDETETVEETVEAVEATPELSEAEKLQKDFNVQYKKAKEEERAHNRAQERADNLEKELKELQAKQVDLSVPPVPDPYSETYADEIAKRDEAIARKAAYDKENEQAQAEQQTAQEQAQQAELEAKQAKVQVFDKNMLDLGANIEKVKIAANTVVEYGIGEVQEDILLEHPTGSFLIEYLANNPQEIERMNDMSVLQTFNHLNELRPKASLLKPKTSNAPEPPQTLKGGGAPELDDPQLQGVVWE